MIQISKFHAIALRQTVPRFICSIKFSHAIKTNPFEINKKRHFAQKLFALHNLLNRSGAAMLQVNNIDDVEHLRLSKKIEYIYYRKGLQGGKTL